MNDKKLVVASKFDLQNEADIFRQLAVAIAEKNGTGQYSIEVCQIGTRLSNKLVHAIITVHKGPTDETFLVDRKIWKRSVKRKRTD
jgi:hypothetical protein